MDADDDDGLIRLPIVTSIIFFLTDAIATYTVLNRKVNFCLNET